MSTSPFCPYCGKSHPPEFRFCPETGKPLPVPGIEVTPDAPPPQSRRFAPPPSIQRQAPAPTTDNRITMPLAVIWLIGAVLVIFIGMLIYILTTGSPETNPDLQATASQIAAVQLTPETTPTSTLAPPTETALPPSPTPTLTATATVTESGYYGVFPPGPWVPCDNDRTPNSNLMVGSYATVSSNPPLPNLLRKEPGEDGVIIGRIHPAEIVYIKQGPKCEDEMVWWFVYSTKDGSTGWSSEGDENSYWLVPYKQQ